MLNEIINQLTEDELDYILTDLYEFYMSFIASSYSENVDAPHIEILADKLTEIYLGDIDNLSVAMPPRHSKSSMVTIAFPLWLIFQDPNLHILIINAEASLSENFGIRIREYIKKYGELFDVYLSDVKHSSTHIKFENSKGELYQGSIRLVGAAGSITGQDADYILLDDIYSGFKDITPTLLRKKIQWFKTMIIQRREPHTKLLILHTRWHTDDLQGYLKENFPNDYEFLSFPAIKDDGTPLWPQRYSLSFLEGQLEEMGERLFSSIYQQKPLDETGSFFNLDKIHFEDTVFNSHYINWVRSWDLAYSDKSEGDERDSTAGIPMYKVSENQYVISDFEYGQFGDELKDKIISTAHSDGPSNTILIEPGPKGGAAKFLYNEYEKALKGYRCEQSEPKGSKSDRAFGLKQAILDGKIYVHIINDDLREVFIKQFKAFPLGKHDDIVDACAYAYNYLEEKGDSRGIYGTGDSNY